MQLVIILKQNVSASNAARDDLSGAHLQNSNFISRCFEKCDSKVTSVFGDPISLKSNQQLFSTDTMSNLNT